MMNSSSPSAETEYVSYTDFSSETVPTVRYRIARMSFARRLCLVRKVRELAQRIEFLEAGSEPRDQIEASMLGAEINGMYLEWGLHSLEGLKIDGESATPDLLIAKGPEMLTSEIVGRIRAECHLSEDERKN